MNTRIPYGHILLSLVLAIVVVMVGLAFLSAEPSSAAHFVTDGIVGVDAANL